MHIIDITFKFTSIQHFNRNHINLITLLCNTFIQKRQELVWESPNHIPLFITNVKIIDYSNVRIQPYKFKNIKKLKLKFCEIMPNKNILKLPNLKSLYMIECACEKPNYFDISQLINLTSLKIRRCSNLIKSSDVSKLINLTYLDITGKNTGIKLKLSDISKLINLTYLDISYHNKSDMKLKDIYELNKLKTLRINGCSKIIKSSRISNFVNLTTLSMYNCNEIHITDISKLISLTSLDISYCNPLESSDISKLINLKKLEIEGCNRSNIKSEYISKLINLTYLNLNNCNQYEMKSSDISKLINLKYLDISGCDQPEMKSKDISKLINLKKLIFTTNQKDNINYDKLKKRYQK